MDGSSPTEVQPVTLKDKVNDVLNETRMLVLGAQVLVGFQYNAFFHPGFSRLADASKWLTLVSLAVMLLVVALVMTPAPLHRIAEEGRDTRRIQRHATRLIACALAPLGLSIGMNVFTVSERLLGGVGAALLSATISFLALLLWYGAGMALRQHREEGEMTEERTQLKDKIQHMLTEARVVLPGAQALLGFQFTAMLSDTFEQLAEPLKIVHLVSLCAMALAVMLLMSPAPFHRIAANGEATARVNRFGVVVLIAAMVPLAVGMAGDFFVVLDLVGHSARIALWGAAALLAMFATFWFAYPLAVRKAGQRGLRRVP